MMMSLYLFVITALYLSHDLPTSAATEIYLANKDVSQSSLGYGGVPERAVDGNANTNYSMNHCMHTSPSDPNPAWWKVDLGEELCIGKVVIINRADCCHDRLEDSIVKVGTTTDISTHTQCGSPVTTSQAGPGAEVTIQCNPTLCGRYVSVHSGFGINPEILTMCEIYVFTGVCNYACPVCSAGEDVIDRNGYLSSQAITAVQLGNAISCDGAITKWEYWVEFARPFRAIVFRPTADPNMFTIVGINDIPASAITPNQKSTYSVPARDTITVASGDLIGLAHFDDHPKMESDSGGNPNDFKFVFSTDTEISNFKAGTTVTTSTTSTIRISLSAEVNEIADPGPGDFMMINRAKLGAVYTAPLTCMKLLPFSEVPINASIDGPRGVSYDPVEGKIYWTDFLNMAIRRSDFDGSNVEDIVTGVVDPFAIRLDTVNRRVYWTQLGASNKGIHYINMNLTGQGIVQNSDSGPYSARALAIGSETGSIYTGYTEGGSQIRRYSLDGMTNEALIEANDGVKRVTGMHVNEEAQKLYWSDEDLHKIEVYDLATGDRTVLFHGENAPRGLAEYKGYLYFIDALNTEGDLYRIAVNGSDAGTPSPVRFKPSDSSGNSAYDIVIHKSDEPSGDGGCGALFEFGASSVGPVCEGGMVTVGVTNFGDETGAVNVTTSDREAIGGADYQNNAEDISLAPGEFMNFTIVISEDDLVEPPETFRLLLLNENGSIIDNGENSKVTVNIAQDLPCRVPVKAVMGRMWSGGFIATLLIPINTEMIGWRLDVNFPRQVFELEIEGCDAEIQEKVMLNLPGKQKGTKYLLRNGPNSAPPDVGSKLHIKFIAKIYRHRRGLKRRIFADFYPQYSEFPLACCHE